MKIQLKNPLKRKFSLPQLVVIAILIAGLAFGGGVFWRNQQRARLAREAADKAALDEAARLAKLQAEQELADKETDEEKPKEEKPKPKPDPEPEPEETASLYLTGSKGSKGVNLSWSVEGLSVTQGFKLLLSKAGTPVYGSEHTDGTYIKDSSDRSYSWGLTNGKTYYFRICIYNGSGCSYYSNTIQVTAPYVAPEKPTGSIDLEGTGGSSPYSNPLAWDVDGGSAIYGFKLVWSESDSTPSYPGSSAKFFEKDSDGGSFTDDAGTYYVRICMYYEGGCLNYSNMVQVEID